MAKYKIYSYCVYRATAEVEADSFEEALEKGYYNNDERLQPKFVGHTHIDVFDENGEVRTF